MLLCIECWDTVGANFSKCGKMKPSAPQNLSVIFDKLNNTHAILHVTWSPPEHYAPTIINYQIEIIDMMVDIIVNGVRYIPYIYIL